MKLFIRLFLIGLLASSNLWSETSPIVWYTLDANKKATIHLDLFLSRTCPHCHKADAFFTSIAPSNPWLRIHRHFIEDKMDLILFGQFLNSQDMQDFSVPSVFFCNSRWRGFATAETSGKDLLHALNYCKQDIEKKGQLTKNTITVLKQQANSNKGVQIIESTSFKSSLFVAVVNLMYTCSIFCLITFLSILFLQFNRSQQVKLGLLFLFTLAWMHFIQQRYMAVYFGMLPWMRIPAALVGLFSIQMARLHYLQRSTPTLPYFITFLLALMIGLYQQTCSTNWFYLFEQWLAQQHFNAIQIALYEITYHITLILPLLLLFFMYVLVMNTKRMEKLKTRLRTIGLLFFAIIGLILIVYPFALASMYTSYLILILLPFCAWLLNRFKPRT